MCVCRVYMCVCVCVIGAWSRRNLGFTIELIRASFRNFLHWWTNQYAEHSSPFLQFALALCFIFNIKPFFKHYLCLVFCVFVFSFLFHFLLCFNLVKIQFYTCFHSLLFKLTYTASHLFFFLSFFLPVLLLMRNAKRTQQKQRKSNCVQHKYETYKIRKYIFLENLLFFFSFFWNEHENNQSQM